MNPTAGSKRLDIIKARQAGYNDNQIIAFAQKNPSIELYDSSVQPTVPQQSTPEQPKTLEGFAGNIGSSAVKNAIGIGSGLLNAINPDLEKNTIANLVRLPFDAVSAVAGDKSPTNRANALVDFYKNRYGSLDKAGNTLYNDPTGVALDASVVLGGAGALAKGAGVVSKSSTLGKIGTALADASSTIDPIAQTTKLAGRGLGKIGEATSDVTKGVRDSSSAFLAKHSIKANPTQSVAFEDITGQDLGRFMSENNIYGANDASKVIAPLQDAYNGLVRTDKAVPGSVFADGLRQKALDIVSKDVSQPARLVAEKLWKEADTVESMGNVTDTILANSKTSTFGKVSSGAMIDPIALNFNKAYGQVGIQTLDKVAPGSAEIGQKLQALREFQDIAKKQSGLGKGAQVFNTLRPGVGGAVVGNMIPGIGPISGAVLGELATNPISQRFAAKVLQNGLPGSNVLSGATKSAYQMGKYGTRLNPQPDQSTPIIPRQSTESTGLGGPQPTVENTYTNNIPQTSSGVNTMGLGASPSNALTASTPVVQKTLTGYTPEKLYKAYSTAIMRGDKTSAAYFRQMWEDESKYQKDAAKGAGGGKTYSATQLKEISDIQNSIDLMNSLEPILSQKADLFGPIKGQMALNPYATESKSLEAQFRAAAQLVGKAMEGGVLRKEDEEKYRKMLPQLTDTPQVAEAKIQNVRKMVEMQLRTKMSIYTNFNTAPEYGLGATPDMALQ